MGFFKWLDNHIRESNRKVDEKDRLYRENNRERWEEEELQEEMRREERRKTEEYWMERDFEYRGGDSCENCMWYKNGSCTLPDHQDEDESEYLRYNDGRSGTPTSLDGSRSKTCSRRMGWGNS